MKEWTEQEEQEMIERAKGGDPEANYELSLWALRRGEEEPDEPRWNRLAAKCLVKAAQAGYGPAREQMEGILHPEASQKAAPRKPAAAAPKKAEPAAPISIHDARQAAARKAPARQDTARRPASRRAAPQDDDFDEDDLYDDEDDEDDDEPDDYEDEDEYDDEPAPRRKGGRRSRPAPRERSGRGEKASRKKAPRSSDGGGRWGDAQWRRLEIICVAICALLLVFIAVMVFTGRRSTVSAGSGASAIPPAGDAATVQSSENTENPAPTAAGYPDQATKDAIMGADLAIQPEEEDYMTAPTSATVSVSSQYLRLRKGPNTTYDPIAEMPNDTVVDVYATKNDWDLVLFQGDSGPIYGWCSSEYLIITAGTAAAPAAGGENTTG